jgi:DNA modification methylase
VRDAKDERDQKHIAPLQLGVIRRLVRLWSNPGEVVWDPFMGIGSTGYVALKEGRRALGAELKETYFRQAAKNLRAAASYGQQMLAIGDV